jgi:hypothetical protein
MAKKEQFSIIQPKPKTPVAKLSDYSKNVQSGIGGQPTYFVEPSPPVKDLKDATDAMNAANVAEDLANDATRKELANQKKKVLEILALLAAYVIGVAKGDRYIASLSGFELTKEETTPKKTGEIKILDTKPGSNDGEAILRLSDKGGYTMFIVERKTAAGDWMIIGAFQLKTYTIKGLPSGSTVVRITGYKSDVPGNSVETVVKAV